MKEWKAWDSELSSPQQARFKSSVCLVEQVNVQLKETQRLIEHKYNLNREISEIEEAKRSAEAELSDLASSRVALPINVMPQMLPDRHLISSIQTSIVCK